MVGGNISVIWRIKVTLSDRKRIKARGARDGAVDVEVGEDGRVELRRAVADGVARLGQERLDGDDVAAPLGVELRVAEVAVPLPVERLDEVRPVAPHDGRDEETRRAERRRPRVDDHLVVVDDHAPLHGEDRARLEDPPQRDALGELRRGQPVLVAERFRVVDGLITEIEVLFHAQAPIPVEK